MKAFISAHCSQSKDCVPLIGLLHEEPTLTCSATPDSADLIVAHDAESDEVGALLAKNPHAALLLVQAGTNLEEQVVMHLGERDFCLVPASHLRWRELVARFLAPDPGPLHVEPVELDLYSRTGKATVTRALEEYVLALGLQRKGQAPIPFAKLCRVVLEELLLNATMANPELANRERNAPFELRTGHPIRTLWSATEDGLLVSVHDPFGTLDVSKALHASLAPTASAASGVGLRFVLSRSEALFFDVIPGRQTRVTCLLGPGSHRVQALIQCRRTRA